MADSHEAGSPSAQPDEASGSTAKAATVGGTARRPVGSYDSYLEAQRAVDFLSDRSFPVERVAIVGHDLELFEQVTGRLTTARAAGAGARQGALLGLVFGALLGLFVTVSGAYLGLLVYGLVVGALFGALLGAVTHAATRGRRDFGTVGGMRANRYEVMVDHDVADEAVRLLGELSAEASTTTPPGGAQTR